MAATKSNPKLCYCKEKYADRRDLKTGNSHVHDGCRVIHYGRECKYQVYEAEPSRV